MKVVPNRASITHDPTPANHPGSRCYVGHCGWKLKRFWRVSGHAYLHRTRPLLGHFGDADFEQLSILKRPIGEDDSMIELLLIATRRKISTRCTDNRKDKVPLLLDTTQKIRHTTGRPPLIQLLLFVQVNAC